jgi:hypothetical protein
MFEDPYGRGTVHTLGCSEEPTHQVHSWERQDKMDICSITNSNASLNVDRNSDFQYGRLRALAHVAGSSLKLSHHDQAGFPNEKAGAVGDAVWDSEAPNGCANDLNLLHVVTEVQVCVSDNNAEVPVLEPLTDARMSDEIAADASGGVEYCGLTGNKLGNAQETGLHSAAQILQTSIVCPHRDKNSWTCPNCNSMACLFCATITDKVRDAVCDVHFLGEDAEWEQLHCLKCQDISDHTSRILGCVGKVGKAISKSIEDYDNRKQSDDYKKKCNHLWYHAGLVQLLCKLWPMPRQQAQARLITCSAILECFLRRIRSTFARSLST